MPNSEEGSDEKSVYETSYRSTDSSTHSSLSTSTMKSWPNKSDSQHSRQSFSHQHDPLRSTLGRSKVTKSTSSYSAQQYIHPKNLGHPSQYHDSVDVITPYQAPPTEDDGLQFRQYYHPTDRNPIHTRSYGHQLEGDEYPRRNIKVPSLFDRIKAALEIPIEPPHHAHGPSSPVQRHRQNYSSPHVSRNVGSTHYQHYLHNAPPPQYSHQPDRWSPTATRFSVHHSEIAERAYSAQCSAMKGSFSKLQQVDSGKVEYRTIAFSTHLTVSRWEPTDNTPIASSASSENTGATTQKPKHDPARLVSLANYIRHLISLTSGVSSNPAQEGQVQPRKQEEPNKPQSPPQSFTHASSGPGPVNRGNTDRYSPHARRQHQMLGHPYSRPHLHRPPSNNEVHVQRPADWCMHDSTRSGEQSYDGTHVASAEYRPQTPQYARPPTTPTRTQYQQESMPLLRLPYPNLTLTLALIYIDRLKAKYPEAKGEAGCSHRLFLIAFIIAAKYRQCVEFSPPISEDGIGLSTDRMQREDDPEAHFRMQHGSFHGGSVTEQQEPRWHAELVFSNHAWVRLLNLGSFHRPAVSAPTTTTTSATVHSAHTRDLNNRESNDNRLRNNENNGGRSNSGIDSIRLRSSSTAPTTTSTAVSPMSSTETTTSSSVSESSTPRRTSTTLATTPTTNLPGTFGPATATGNNNVLQVEDLDRMEKEFLTFLNGDLATMSNDLETCWNLLVGKK